MKIRSMASVLVIAMAFSLTLADDASSVYGKSKALLFTFNGLNTLGAGSYAGGVGGKYFLSDAMALRGGLQFANTNTTVPANPPAGQTGADGSNWSLAYGLNGGLEYHLTASRVSPYLGGAASVTSTSTEVKNAVNATGGVQTTTKNGGGAGLKLGVGGIAGVEFFVTKEISLGAEYTLGYALTSLYDQTVTAGPTTTTTKQGSVSTISISNAGGLTLCVYF